MIERQLAAFALILKRPHVRRQQAVKPEGVALELGECCALVQARVNQQVVAGEVGANHRPLCIRGHRGRCAAHGV